MNIQIFGKAKCFDTKKAIICENTVPSGAVLVDGSGVGEVGSVVMRDRHRLAEDGMVVVVMPFSSQDHVLIADPEIVTRGFIYVKEAEDLMEELRRISQRALDRCIDEQIRDWTTIKANVKNDLSEFLYRKTKRSPMILPVIMEI